MKGEFKIAKRRAVASRKREEKVEDSRYHRNNSGLHQGERTFGCVTQNVNGFGATAAHKDEWLRAFRVEDMHERYDVVMLQETHVEQEDVSYMTVIHARQWGFKTGASCPTLSLWSPAMGRKGGVAMLIDPYGSLKEICPVLQAHWSPHFMAATGVLEGTAMVFVCIYAPHQQRQREEFYRWLYTLKLPIRERTVLGGVFNCTVDEIADRSHVRPHSGHASPGLADLLQHWGLMDAEDPLIERDSRALKEYQERTHTYSYSLETGRHATARLDRWYTSAELSPWVAHVEVCHPGTRADHSAVRLHLVCPRDPIRIKKPPRVYPPPSIAAEQVNDNMKQQLKELKKRMGHTTMDAKQTATAWEEAKTTLRMDTLRIIRQRRETARATYKQKCRRLLRQEQRILDAAAGVAHTVETVTDMLDALTLHDRYGATPLQRVRHAITDCVRARMALKQRRLFNRGGYHVGKTSKAFFRRVSTKLGDNVVHRLDPAVGHRERGAHDQPDTMADAWQQIFQQEASAGEDRHRVLQWLGPPGQYAEHLADITEPIAETEVAAAIRASHAGKACGPDRLGNDWYRDFRSLLEPILTLLFNKCYSSGVMPPSFLEANIFCLKKGGAAQDPLNFRPLSLMNTDYKLLTRILATRASWKLPRMIHPNQNGFVPWRSIHATLDLFAAAQQEAKTNPALAAALALLLDFSKAYDSVDREFLYAVLLWLGFPTAFVAAIRAMHEGTRVRFLANGRKSRWIMVTCGIRQGCPLAPLIFILVLEALYRRIDKHPAIHGIILRSRMGSVTLKVGGYADDTASYVKDPSEIVIVLEITRQFALASGLRLNEKKTMVIALNADHAAQGVELPAPLRLQDLDQLARYLGVQVGSRPDVNYTWQLAHSQLVIRLRLAIQKTTTVDQRSTIVAAIVIPKLLFIGRQQWPTQEMIDLFQRRIHTYVWKGQ